MAGPNRKPQSAPEMAFDNHPPQSAPEIADTAAQVPMVETTIHATECVVNSECTFTPGCRGRLKPTAALSGKVQIYCPKCHRFAEGTRPLNGLMTQGVGKLFDRVSAK